MGFVFPSLQRIKRKFITGSSYSYDGDGTRARKTTGGANTSYVWDRQSGLPQLVDDGAQSYVQAGAAREQIDRSGTTGYLLHDALGSVRGVGISSGALGGSADYDVFGCPCNNRGRRWAVGQRGWRMRGNGETGMIVAS